MRCVDCKYFKETGTSSYWVCYCKDNRVIKKDKCDKFQLKINYKSMSELLRLSKNDAVKALFLVVLMAFYSALSNAVGWSIDWNELLKVVVIGVLSYLTKNLGTNTEGKILGKY